MKIEPDDIIGALEQLTLMGRSEQVEIGPSEVGIECKRCLARKLAEYQKASIISSWRTTIGRAVHELAERDVPPQFPTGALIAEGRLLVHEYKNFRLAGSSDLFAPNDGAGMVLDYKVVGDDTLEKVAKAVEENKPINPQYITQGNLYGVGWTRLGYTVKDVCILFLPANKGDLRKYHVKYQYEYDPVDAAKALALVELLIDLAEEIGWEAVVRKFDPRPGCLSCATYAKVDNPQVDFLVGFGKTAPRRKSRNG